MLEAFIWGFLAACSLVIGDRLATYLSISRRALGIIMAFGVGVLISAVSFNLVEEAFQETGHGWVIIAGLFSGALVFFGGSMLVERFGGRSYRQITDSRSRDQAGSGLAILLGTALDGIPESIVIGLSLVKGGSIGVAMIVAVFVSNLPEAIASTAGLKAGGWKSKQTLGLWLLVAFLSGLAALAGFALFDTAGAEVLAYTLSFAAGALLTMVADSMMPQAYEDSGKLVGVVTTLGFSLAYIVNIL